MFKVGDKVRRKVDELNTNAWTDDLVEEGLDPLGHFTVTSTSPFTFGDFTIDRRSHDPSLFELVGPTIVEFWPVSESYDRSSTVVARFSSERVATEYASSKGVCYSVGFVQKLMIFDSVSQVEEYSVANIRRRAIAKLTKEERIALGL